MRVTFLTDREFALVLKNCFDHSALLDRLRSLGATILEIGESQEANLKLKTNQVKEIRDLARAIWKIRSRGKEYQWHIWPWSCRRTAISINRLRNLVMEYRRTGKHEVLPPQLPPPAAGPKRSPALRTPIRRTPDPDEDDIFEILEEYAKIPESDLPAI